MNLSKARKILSNSAVMRLKELWRSLRKDEKDYWRAQFASGRTLKSIRGEMATRLGIMLFYDFQLSHFRKWVAERDRQLGAIEKFEAEASAALLHHLNKPGPARSDNLVLWLYCHCLNELRRRARNSLSSGRSWTSAEVDKFYDDALFVIYLGWLVKTTPRNHLN